MSTLRWTLSILLFLALLMPGVLEPAPAYAGGVVTVCDEAHLLAALAGGGTVTFTCSGTITLTAEIVISADTTIDGSGQTVTISGNHSVRVFTNSGFTLNLNELTVANGYAESGGGIFNDGTLNVNNSIFSGNSTTGYGGGIRNDHGTLNVNNSIFSGNSSTGLGGGIYNNGTVTLSNCTFSGNSARGGGGISNNYYGTVEVSNSTFFANSATDFGGGLSNLSDVSSPMTVNNSTFSGNSASSGGTILVFQGPVTLRNTIVANSPTGDNCAGAPITDGGGNLSYPDATCPGINADPVLGPLQDNGGPTWTMELGEGSAAIDAGDDAICAAAPVNNLDQRGVTRPQGAHCDIGSVEQITDPTAVNLTGISAQSASGALPPMLVLGLLLVALASIGVARRGRQTDTN
ncbi:MAG: hypothetical protein KDI55_14995 [Anaerolineae bacterium]|nr:hypothetical protein [Anaerolineae bacterium]